MTQPVITNSQIKKIHALVHALRWKDEWYRDNLCSHFNVESSTDLTYQQAEGYIDMLERQAISAGVWKPASVYHKEVITNSQIKKIHTLVHALRWKDEWYRDNLCSHFNVESSTDLTYQQAEGYIDMLERQAISAGVWKPASVYHKEKEREDMATDKQIRMINAMWSEISYEKNRKKKDLALGKLLERIVKVSHINFLLKEDVKKVVNALKAMKKAKEKKDLKRGA